MAMNRERKVKVLTESEFQEFMIVMGYRYNEKSKTAFNTFMGFHCLIGFGISENRYTLRLGCTPKSTEDILSVLEELNDFHDEHKDYIVKYSFKKTYISMELKKTIDSDIDKEQLRAVVHLITVLCKSERLAPICRVCSRQRKTGVYVVGSEMMPICDACVGRKRRLYEKRRDLFEKKQQHMAAGIVGAVFGATLGAMMNILMYQLCPLKGVWSIFIIVLCFCGFVVTGKRATKKSGVICAAISSVIFVLSEYAAMVLETAIGIERDGGHILISESIDITNSVLSDPANLASFAPEIAAGLLVILATGIVYFLKRMLTRPMKISKNLL